MRITRDGRNIYHNSFIHSFFQWKVRVYDVPSTKLNAKNMLVNRYAHNPYPICCLQIKGGSSYQINKYANKSTAEKYD